MPKPPYLDSLREVLARLFPMQGVVVVGAGRGRALSAFSGATALLTIDAMAENVECLQRQVSAWPKGIAVRAVIAGQSGLADFHIASNVAESSLIPPTALEGLWRNLKTRDVEVVETLTLPDLLARLESPVGTQWNWLVVDCLPALPLLESAGSLVDTLDVLELRCIRDTAEISRLEAVLSTCAAWLEARGFRLVAEEEETHPELCTAVFCRDAGKLSERLTHLERERAQQNETCAEQALGLADVTQAKAAAEKLAADRHGQLDALNKEKATLAAEREALAKEKAALTAERDALAKRAATLSAEYATLSQAVLEHQQRQSLLDEEMVKANAQLDLLKDLLLREPGL
ncbi:MAG: hypothetical protein ABTQ28_14165 [Thauera sp.]